MMKTYILPFLLIVLPITVWGQTDTTYFDKTGTQAPKNSAQYYRVVNILTDNSYTISDYFIDSQQLLPGYFPIVDSIHFKRCLYKCYNFIGIKQSEGTFDESSLPKEWKGFYPNSGEIMYERTNGISLTYELTTYFENGKIMTREKHQFDKSTSGKSYDQSGKEIDFVPAMCIPQPAFDMQKLFMSNLHFPDQAREAGIDGKVLVRFVVNNDGKISNPVIVRHVEESLDEEVLHLVSLMGKWTPGQINGIYHPMYVTIPIVFKLE